MLSTLARSSVPARLAAIATHVPDRVLSNEELAADFPDWSASKILEKTGILERRIAAPGETALDLAAAACGKLLARDPTLLQRIDFLILCTQAPDYILPTSACLLQDRMGLPTSIGALDINLGCSGFVYGLSLAAGLIGINAAQTVLLVTADTYSKYINEGDKSVRTLFGDGAAATVITRDASGMSSIGPFVFGTDGSGGDRLMVPAGGFRLPRSAETAAPSRDRSGNMRGANDLFMDGGAVLNFTLTEVPRAYRRLIEYTGAGDDPFDQVVLHQANKFMIDALQKKLGLPDHKVPRHYESIGNTVSSTIPFVLAGLMDREGLRGGTRIAAIGFGVGLSWAAVTITI